MPELEPGDVFDLSGSHYIVLFVNQSRARCVALKRQVHDGRTRFGRTFQILKDTEINISPQSEVAVISRGGQRSIDEFYASRKREVKPTEEQQDLL